MKKKTNDNGVVRRSNNPAIRKMVDTANKVIGLFHKCCPELAAFTTERIRKNRCRGLEMRLCYEENVLLYRTLQTAGLDNPSTTTELLGTNSELLWDLVDAAKRQHGATWKSLDAVWSLYVYLHREKRIRRSFRESRRSPYGLLSTDCFRKFLKTEYTCRDDVFVIGYAWDAKKQIVCIKTRAPYLRQTIVDAFEDWPNKWDRKRYSTRLVKEAETWFGDTALHVKGWDNFDATTLSTAKDFILEHFEGAEREERMKFLFFMYSRLVKEHPHYPFFGDSFIYTNSMVLDKRVPGHLSKGYQLAIYGQNDSFHQGVGALFILRNAKRHGASNRTTEIIAFTLKEVDIPCIWDAIANYLLHHNKRQSICSINFCRWLCKNKKLSGNPVDTITWQELQEFRVWVCQKSDLAATRNCHINQVRAFINWCAGKGYLKPDKNCMRGFDLFSGAKLTKPNPLTNEETQKLLVALEALAETNPRFKLVLNITRILLTDSMRIGTISTMTVNSLEFRSDGTAVLTTMKKNRGRGYVTQPLTEETTALLREAITLTEPIRQRCPQEGIGEHIFIYENGKECSLPFGRFTVTRFNEDLCKAAEKARIRRINSGMLRDTYMSEVELYRIKKGLSDAKKRVLTEHNDPLSINSYARIKIVDILEAARYIRIGKILK